MRAARLLTLVLTLSLATAGCAVELPGGRLGSATGSPGPGPAGDAATKKVTPAATTSPTPPGAAGAPTPSVDPRRRLVGITGALADAAIAREILRAQGVTRILSNNGGSLVSDPSAGLVSKIRTGVVSDNGGSLISNNGGGVINEHGAGLISDKGVGYWLAQASDVPAPTPGTSATPGPATTPAASATPGAATPPASSATPDAAATPELYREIPHSDPPFQYVSTFYKPNFRGTIVGFLASDYSARGRQAEVVERYVWDDVPFTVLDTPSTGIFDVRATFPMRVELSRRTAFTRKIDLVIDMAIKALQPIILTAFKSMAVTFEMAVPGRDGAAPPLTVNAHDFVYPPGKGPGETVDGVYPTPTGFKADGANERGTLTLTVTTPPGGTIATQLDATYVRAGGGTVRTALTHFVDGRREETTTDMEGGVAAALRYAATGAGEGELRDVASGRVIGQLRWDAKGVGSAALTGADEIPLTLF